MLNVSAEDITQTDKFYENISENTVGNNRISAIIKFNYENVKENTDFTDDLKTNQELLKSIRSANKAYYTENNLKYVEDVNIDYPDMRISSYSPFVFIEFDSYAMYAEERSDLIQLSEDERVAEVYIDEITDVDSAEEAEIETDISQKLWNFEDIKDMIGVSSSTYDGSGIKIGIYDSGHVDDTSNFLNGHIAQNADIKIEPFPTSRCGYFLYSVHLQKFSQISKKIFEIIARCMLLCVII